MSFKVLELQEWYLLGGWFIELSRQTIKYLLDSFKIQEAVCFHMNHNLELSMLSVGLHQVEKKEI